MMLVAVVAAVAVPVRGRAAPDAVPEQSDAVPEQEETGKGLISSASIATSDPSWGYNTIYVGPVFRPHFCLYNCDDGPKVILGGGIEVGDRYFGLAIRYLQEKRNYSITKEGVRQDHTCTFHEISPDLRAFYPFKVGMFILAPFFEITPLIMFGDGVSGFHAIVRPGFRVTALVHKNVDVSLEPFGLDINWYQWERYPDGSKINLGLVLRYNVSLSVHARW
jgi:hypothetical protein